eukprot:COSAG06_NODE_13392_length_1261_cov_23.743546_1_plen_101_part_00
MESACDLASWGILDKYSAFVPSHTSLNFVTTMSTWYQGKNLTTLRSNTEAILTAGFEPDAVHLGVSNQVRKTPFQPFLEPFLFYQLKTIDLPRQARDKHI